MNSYICPQSRMFFLHCFSMLCKKYFQVINIYLCPTISFRLLHLFYLRLRLQLKNLLPGAFQTKILLLLGGTKYCIIFSYNQQFSFFRFSACSWAREYIFSVFFDIFLPNFFLKKLSRIGDFPRKFAYPTPSYKMPKKAPIPHQILHCGTGDSRVGFINDLHIVCWKGLSSLLGCSTDLLNSCVQGAHAKTPPSTVRRGVPGINTYPTLQVTEAPLLNKGDTVEK